METVSKTKANGIPTPFEWAQECREFDISTVPIGENKIPNRKWGPLQKRLWNGKEESGFKSAKGIAVVCGDFANIECIDFDNHYGNAKECWDKFCSDKNVKYLLDKYPFYIETTKSGGYHLVYTVDLDEWPKGEKLAHEYKIEDGERVIEKGQFKTETLIETRSQGQYFVSWPTPNYNKISGSIFTLPEILPEERQCLLDKCRDLTRIDEQDNPEPTSGSSEKGRLPAITDPVSYFNWHKTSYAKNLLQDNGWRLDQTDKSNKEHWTRPGKEKGHSATFNYNGNNMFYVFSSNGDPFETDTHYTPFNILTLLRFNGDYHKALRWTYLILPESFNIGSNKFEGWGTDIADFFKAAKKDGFEPPFEDVLNELLETQLQGPEPALTPEMHKPSVEDYYFWEAQLDKDDNFKQISISQSILLDLLHHIGGFAKIKLSDNFQYIKKDERIFKKIKLVEIKDYINGFLDDLAKEDENITDWNGYSIPVALLREKLIRGSNNYFGAATMENLPTISFNPLRDTKDTAYLYFKNGFVTITADQVIIRPFSELPGDIWQKQILQREITLQDSEEPCEFERFLVAVSGNKNRFNSIGSYIGFLLHGYHDPSRPQVVVLYDEKESGKPQDYETAQGGTGKGILVNALTELCDSVIIDGKSFKQQNDFPWQRLSVTTQLVAFQDVTNNFKFSNLHSVVTDGITVNKKHRPEIYIPFSESPKFIITTNYIIDTSEDSDRRRIKEIELFPHFSPKYTPQDQFGHLLFDDWNDEEWCKFYNLMMGFIKHYLKDGFIDPPASESAAERKFASRFGQEMLDEFNELQISTTRDHVNGVHHDAKAIREKCTDKSTSLSGGQFAQALKNYCVLAQDIEPPLEFWRSNGKRYFMFYGKKKRDYSNN